MGRQTEKQQRERDVNWLPHALVNRQHALYVTQDPSVRGLML